ncbi:MAG: hypothetical protein UT90_C0005G0008 [Parcubacteria group bacterium GW2011_GWA1_40_21]|nr:MAG: hypothetical protein UT80_C0052G0009 [Parcubacteria group bacterium GW2011_GWC1_40_13]KKR53701.1 MAG: hypothetical protein UT90_C0005G0008 [Parcubacteria group bacterium GW2011_GWA1_40_21]
MLNNFLSFISNNLPDLERIVLDTLISYSPIWLPILLIIIGWKLWVRYIRALFWSKQKRILLEIKLPKEITKSPLAMETFLIGLHQTGREGTWYAKFWEGKTRPWFSLEMVSTEGVVRFFIWTEASFKNIIEAQLYAQYPTVEIYEAPDYTEGVFFDKDKIGLMGTNFEFSKSSAYPIKTYVDYGLDKADTKEEYKTDPITPIIEFLGSMGKGEQAWIQILIRAHKKEQIKKGTWFEKADTWQDEAKEEIEKIRKEATPETESDYPAFPNPTKGQIEKIAAIEKNVSKLGFDCGIRIIYLAEKNKFNKGMSAAMTGITRQFHSNNLNSFKSYGITFFDYPWQDYKSIRVNKKKKKMLNAYKLRSYFYPPYQKKWFVINTEGLASIFHLPGSVAQTPSFARIVSKKAEPPSNLPI